jgi:hypothetical protein
MQLWGEKNVTKTGFTVYSWVDGESARNNKSVGIKWMAVAVADRDKSNNGHG